MDYDLVIIGSTPEGIYAAQMAIYLKARVALVEQPFQEILGTSERVFQQTWYHFLNVTHQYNQIQRGNYNLSGKDLKQWSEEVNSILKEQNSLGNLAALGVDLISGSGEFCSQPHLGFRVKDRYLRSRSYLIATGSHFSKPTLADFDQVGYLTLNDICQLENPGVLPENLVIIGQNNSSLEVAQILARLGKKITLINETDNFLAKEDPSILRLLQTKLETENITIIQNQSIFQVKLIEGKKWLQVGDLALETDQIIWLGYSEPNVEGLNLKGVGVNWYLSGIKVNCKLQTTNSKIYACGNVIGADNLVHFGKEEARIAIKNGLFFPIFKINYHNIPYLLFTDPPLAKVGLTETEALRRFNHKVFCYQVDFKHLPKVQLQDQTTGFCKLIIKDNGTILGGYLWGEQAEEVINIIALAINNNMKITALKKMIYPSWTVSEIINFICDLWQQQRLNRYTKLLKTFHGFRH